MKKILLGLTLLASVSCFADSRLDLNGFVSEVEILKEQCGNNDKCFETERFEAYRVLREKFEGASHQCTFNISQSSKIKLVNKTKGGFDSVTTVLTQEFLEGHDGESYADSVTVKLSPIKYGRFKAKLRLETKRNKVYVIEVVLGTNFHENRNVFATSELSTLEEETRSDGLVKMEYDNTIDTSTRKIATQYYKEGIKDSIDLMARKDGLNMFDFRFNCSEL